ncbi:MAG: heavy metal translocating P-type ATPase [Verrucomicrobia bacterium]|nr:heavy metal translocating P-type ATPase [Verrucomicrobiota bacterium]
MKSPGPGPTHSESSERCLVRLVADAMKEEPALSAVKIDRRQRSISVATLGKPASATGREDQLTAQIRHLEETAANEPCELLDGKTDCSTCPVPMAAAEREKITIQHDGHSTTIARITCPTAPRLWRWRDSPWPKFVPREVVLPEDAEHEHEWKLQLAAAVLCGASGLAAFLLAGRPLAILAYLLAYVAGAWFTAHEVWERLQKGALDVHFLMLAVAVGSASIGAWGEGATLLFLFSLSGALEHYAMGRTHREIRSLFRTAPKVATRLDDQGNQFACPVDQLRPGMRLLVKPGEQFPVDAEVAKGSTAADESNLTGESTPAEKGIGDSVLAGTLNLWGVVEVLALRPASQSALQKIIHLIREAQHLKAPSQRLTDRFGTGYTYAILGLTLSMFFVWWLGAGVPAFLSNEQNRSAFYRAMTLLVVASPCALVLSIPSAILAAIAWAARRGILFRGGAAVEKLAEVTIVAMDKTGTLTTGELRVERVESFPPGREAEVAQLAYSLERLSTHPLARAITRFGKQQRLKPLDLQNFESVTGSGLRAKLGAGEVFLGRRQWLEQIRRESIPIEQAPTDLAFSEVWLAKDSLVGCVLLRDDIRPRAAGLLEDIRRLGLTSVVLTGDRRGAADYLKERLALDEIRAELKPEQKVEIIAAFIRERRKVAMVGDGVNDAPSLAAAHVGVAMGARGSDAALEQAEVVLMHDRLENFLAAFQLSQRARRIIRQNLVVSLGTVAVLVAFALFGSIPLTVGVVGHEGSTVVVVLNSLRLLLGVKPPKELRQASARH